MRHTRFYILGHYFWNIDIINKLCNSHLVIYTSACKWWDYFCHIQFTIHLNLINFCGHWLNWLHIQKCKITSNPKKNTDIIYIKIEYVYYTLEYWKVTGPIDFPMFDLKNKISYVFKPWWFIRNLWLLHLSIPHQRIKANYEGTESIQDSTVEWN